MRTREERQPFNCPPHWWTFSTPDCILRAFRRLKGKEIKQHLTVLVSLFVVWQCGVHDETAKRHPHSERDSPWHWIQHWLIHYSFVCFMKLENFSCFALFSVHEISEWVRGWEWNTPNHVDGIFLLSCCCFINKSIKKKKLKSRKRRQ